ncbi:hypothetical protein B0H13DRAFT_2308504 [Mycena leptocephala]|nr:hypothetical protein B0H13DRAFT_2308504 [Mycena leptocephala]
MTSDRISQNATEPLSTVGTEFYSVPNTLGLGPEGSSLALTSDVAQGNLTQPPSSAGRGATSASQGSSQAGNYISKARLPKISILTDDEGWSYTVDQFGQCVLPFWGTPWSTGPLQHLFRTPSEADEPSTESVLSESTPPDGLGNKYPNLTLDIDLDTLMSNQVAQLNAIHGHLGTTHARLLATTALVAKQQGSTEDIQEALQIMRETGASSAHIKELLLAMSKHRHGATPAGSTLPITIQSVTPAKEIIPTEVQAHMNTVIPPRSTCKSHEDFEKWANVVLRTKDMAHSAFPLLEPTAVLNAGVPQPLLDPLHQAARVGFLPSDEEYQSVRSASQAGIAQQIEHTRRWRGAQDMVRSYTGTFSNGLTRPEATLVAMNNSASAYALGNDGAGQDIMADFADNAADLIRDIIENKVGNHIDLPAHVRTPKVCQDKPWVNLALAGQ